MSLEGDTANNFQRLLITGGFTGFYQTVQRCNYLQGDPWFRGSPLVPEVLEAPAMTYNHDCNNTIKNKTKQKRNKVKNPGQAYIELYTDDLSNAEFQGKNISKVKSIKSKKAFSQLRKI